MDKRIHRVFAVVRTPKDNNKTPLAMKMFSVERFRTSQTVKERGSEFCISETSLDGLPCRSLLGPPRSQVGSVHHFDTPVFWT